MTPRRRCAGAPWGAGSTGWSDYENQTGRVSLPTRGKSWSQGRFYPSRIARPMPHQAAPLSSSAAAAAVDDAAAVVAVAPLLHLHCTYTNKQNTKITPRGGRGLNGDSSPSRRHSYGLRSLGQPGINLSARVSHLMVLCDCRRSVSDPSLDGAATSISSCNCF